MTRAELIQEKRKRNKEWYAGLSAEKKSERAVKAKQYFIKYPWIKHYHSAKNRVFGNNPKHHLYKGLPFTITKEDVKELWDRDRADKMKKASLDRIQPHVGYILSNFRFIELSLNVRRGNHYKPLTTKEPATRNAQDGREYRARIRQIKELLEENRVLKARQKLLLEKIGKLTNAYDYYIDILKEELNEVVPMANVHGWKSSRYEMGVEARKASASCLAIIEKEGLE